MKIENSKGRIVIFGNSATSMVNFRGPLIKHFVENEVDVYALAPGYDKGTREAIRSMGATPVDLAMSRSGQNPFHELRLCIQLLKLLRGIRPDALISYFIKPAIYGSVAGWLAKIPVRIALIEGLGYSFQKGESEACRRRVLRTLVTIMFRVALTRASNILVLNEDDRREFINLNIGRRGKIKNVGGIGVDLNDFSYKPLGAGPPTFLCAARLIREKGIADFAEAARIVKLISPEIQFIILGGVDNNPGSLDAETLNQWVQEGTIVWPGSVTDVRPWLENCSVFVLPSYYREGVPRSIQEAMAVGRAIITTDNVGCRDTVEPGVNGLVVNARRPEELAEAILEIANDRKRIILMGQKSRAFAEERYDAIRFNSYVLDLAFPSRT